MKVGFMSKILFVNCGLLVISQSIVIQLNKQVVYIQVFLLYFDDYQNYYKMDITHVL